MNLVEYFEKVLGRHSGESLPNFSSFVTCVETKKLFEYFEKTLVAIKVKAFQFSFLLWPVWKQINLVEYFEMALGRHSGESLSIFLFLWPVWKQINLLSILKRHFAAIKVKAFKFSVLLWDGMG